MKDLNLLKNMEVMQQSELVELENLDSDYNKQNFV